MTVFSNREMILERDKIEKTLFKTVKERLGGRCCERNCTVPPNNANSDGNLIFLYYQIFIRFVVEVSKTFQLVNADGSLSLQI